MTESAVKTIKKLFTKAQRQNEDAYLALLAHRSAPSTNDSMSPAQKLLGRNIRTHLPGLRALVNKPEKRIIQVPTKFQQPRWERVKYYYNRTAKNLPEIPNGTTVRIRENNPWPMKAKVIKKANTPWSFIVEIEKGTIRRRNRHDLLVTDEQFASLPTDTPDITSSESTCPDGQKDVPLADLPTNNLSEELESNSTEHYRSRLSSSITPPKRFGFDE